MQSRQLRAGVGKRVYFRDPSDRHPCTNGKAWWTEGWRLAGASNMAERSGGSCEHIRAVNVSFGWMSAFISDSDRERPLGANLSRRWGRGWGWKRA